MNQCCFPRESASCELIKSISINNKIFRLDFVWPGAAPRAGQFFMIKPKRGSLFLARPISVALWEPDAHTVKFLIARRGKGTCELAELRPGEEAELTGPLGNAWADFPADKKSEKKQIALIGGGIGIAPLQALAAELPENSFDFFAGFKTGFRSLEEKSNLLGPALFGSARLTVAEETISNNLLAKIQGGRIPDFLNPANYAAVYACGPEAMLEAVAEKCVAAEVPCYVSMERRMACGVGACLGCTVTTSRGNRRCCADGPIFPASEVFASEMRLQ